MSEIVYLLDVDNTLLDNDAVTEDLRRHLRNAFGDECERRYWEIFEQLRRELGYADYLGALQRYRVERPRDTQLLRVSLFLLESPSRLGTQFRQHLLMLQQVKQLLSGWPSRRSLSRLPSRSFGR